MRLIVAIEIEDGENFSAEMPLTIQQLQWPLGKMAEKLGQPLLKAVLEGFDEPLPEDAAARRKALERGVKRSIEAFRARRAREIGLDASDDVVH